MPLDPDIEGVLELLAATDSPSLSASTPTDARASFRMLTVDLRDPESVVEVGEVRDLEVDGGDGPQAARMYLPPEAGTALPVIAFFHGGGFVIGDLDTHDNQARTLCREIGALVVSVDYRLAPEHPWPAAVEDCLAATRWIAAHAAELGGDPARLAVAGDSAGGNLATVVARHARDEDGPALAAQLLVYPVTDLTADAATTHASRRDNAEGYFLTSEDMVWFDQQYAGAAERTNADVSPLYGDVAGLPPAVVVTAEFDPLRDEGEAYARKLEDAGVPVTHRRYDGLVHGFFGMGPLSPACDVAVKETCADLAGLLASSGA